MTIFDDLKALPKCEDWMKGWFQGPGGLSSDQISYCPPITHESYFAEYEPMVSALGLTYRVRGDVGHRLGLHFKQFLKPLHSYFSGKGYIKFYCAGSKWNLCKDEPPNPRLIYIWCGVKLDTSYAERKYEWEYIGFKTLFCNLDNLEATSWTGVLKALEMASIEPVRKALEATITYQRKLAKQHEDNAIMIEQMVGAFCKRPAKVAAV